MPNLSDYDIDPEAMHLKDFLDEVLGVLVSVYESLNVPLPARRYWTMGVPAVDCEQAVVSFVQMYLGAPGDEASRPVRCDSPRTAVLTIQISREIPVVKQRANSAPSGEEIQAASGWQAVDSWTLMDNMEQFDIWGKDLGGRGPGVIATVSAPTPQGGYSTVELQLTIAVP